MPVFTSIGLGLGATAATAFGVGVGATALAVGVGAGAVALSGGFDGGGGDRGSSVDSRIQTATGEITEAEAQTAAKKRAFRSGVLFTSPTGLDQDPRTSSAKLR
jgi:hypothetical protein